MLPGGELLHAGDVDVREDDVHGGEVVGHVADVIHLATLGRHAALERLQHKTTAFITRTNTL